MTQENTKPPESRRSPGNEQGSDSRSAASKPAKPGEPKQKLESECLPCEESRSFASTGPEGASGPGDHPKSDSDAERRTAPGQQGRTGSTYGGKTAENEMEAEGGAEGRREPKDSSPRSGRPERPSR
jgi:hypothetical protein